MSTKKYQIHQPADDDISAEAKMLVRLKDIFRGWYGSLSVKEIITNKRLISEIEAFERLLMRRKAAPC
jgi:hypothetical protein